MSFMLAGERATQASKSETNIALNVDQIFAM